MGNTIYSGVNNKVKYLFTFVNPHTSVGLGIYDQVKICIGGEGYDTVSTPNNLYIENYTDLLGRTCPSAVLVLDIGRATTLVEGSYQVDIRGFNPFNPDGEILSINGSMVGEIYVKSGAH